TRWSAAALYTMLCMNCGIGMVYSDIAFTRSSVEPVDALSRKMGSPPSAIVGYSLGHVEDSLAFHFHGRPIRNFEQHETDGVVKALRNHPASLLLANAAHYERLQRDASADLQLVELGRHRHVVVAVPRDRMALSDEAARNAAH